MKLVFLHGPPASGKFTIGEALRAEIGCRNLHNHLTLDVAKAVLPFVSEPFWALVRALRRTALEAIARQPDLTVVYTACYSHPDYDFGTQVEAYRNAIADTPTATAPIG